MSTDDLQTVATLDAAIMNIPVSEKVRAELDGAPKGFYLLGHRDARHAAAELAVAALARIEALERERDEARSDLAGARYYLMNALAVQLAEKDGHEGDAKHEMVLEGGPVAQPWGEVWQRYEPEAQALVDAAFASVKKWSDAEDQYVNELRDECIKDRDEAIARAEKAEAERDEAYALLTRIGDFAHDRSKGPAEWDPLWEIRSMAYSGAKA